MEQSRNQEQEVLKYFDEDFFGVLAPYIADIDITDIDCNGRQVWVRHVSKGKNRVDIDFFEEDILNLAYKVSNTENAQFNVTHPTLKADLHDLRFEFTHPSFSVSGASCTIRKTPVINRVKESGLQIGNVEYLTKEANTFLEYAIKSRFNVVICGLTGSGKTELVKYLMDYTYIYERIITIEDTSELHLPLLYPDKDIVELKVNEFIDYEQAIKICMRLNPVWMLFSESRGKEVSSLMKSISTGAKIVTTLHTDNAKAIPSRMLNMFEEMELSNDRIETMIYDYIDLGIHIRADTDTDGKILRYVDQIVYFELDENNQKKCHDIYKVKRSKEGLFTYTFNKLPDTLVEKFMANGFYMEE